MLWKQEINNGRMKDVLFFTAVKSDENESVTQRFNDWKKKILMYLGRI